MSIARSPHFFRPDAAKRIAAICGTSLVAHWGLQEKSGATAIDSGFRHLNGTHTGVTLNQPGPGRSTSGLYDGSSDFTNVYSAALAAAFNGSAGTIGIWAKIPTTGIWTDTVRRRMIQFYVNGSNYVHIIKSGTDNTIEFAYNAGGTSELVNATQSSLAFVFYALTWDKPAEAVKAYMNGSQTGTTQTSLGSWSGTPAATNSLIGAFNTVPANVMSGNLAHALLLNRAATASEVKALMQAVR